MTRSHPERPHRGMSHIVLMPANSPKHDTSRRYWEALGAGSCNTDTAKLRGYCAYTGHGDIMEMRNERKAGHIFRKGCGALRDHRRAYSGGLAGRVCMERPDS